MADDGTFAPLCPVAASDTETVQLAHGGGGGTRTRLIERLFLEAFDNAPPARRHDGAALAIDGARLAFSTDSYVVSPLFFPGGDIGTLAVNGTVNDLAMCGARPLYLSAGFILEEGLPMATLRRVVASMKAAAQAADVTDTVRAAQFAALGAAVSPGAPATSVVLFDSTGHPVAWAGRHRVPVTLPHGELDATITPFYAVLTARRQQGPWTAGSQVLLAADSAVRVQHRSP